MLHKAGHEHNLDVDLLASLVKAESNGNAHAVSRAGAQGLMQLMPATAKDLGVEDSFKPEENVRGGIRLLDALLTRYHDNLALALAAYNAGPEAVENYHGIPPYRETQAYVARVIHEFNRRVLAREAQAKQAAPRNPEPTDRGCLQSRACARRRSRSAKVLVLRSCFCATAALRPLFASPNKLSRQLRAGILPCSRLSYRLD